MSKFKSIASLLGNSGYKSTAAQSSFGERGNKKYGQDNFDFLSLIKEWEDIVGPRLAEHTIPLKNSRNILTVLSDHSAFSQQLSFLEQVLVRKVTDRFPSLVGKIKKIQFQTNPRYFREQMEIKEPLKRKTETISEITHRFSPMDKQLFKEAEEMFQDIQDDEIKKSLTSIFIQFKKSHNNKG